MTLRCPDTSSRETRDGARMKTRYLLLSFVSLLACSTPDSAPAPAETRSTSTPSALEAAHEAYLQSDWLTMSDRLRDVLLDRAASALVRENAFELLDKAYEATNGKLPSRFEKPKGVRVIKLGSSRGQHAWATYRTNFLYLQVDPGLGPHVTDIVVRTLPGPAVLDRAGGIGEVRVTPLAEEGIDEVVIEAKNVTTPVEDGVASIHVGFDDGRVIDTWTLVRGLASSASPEISVPSTSMTFSEESPTFEWTAFRSPEYAPFEGRTLSVYVSEDKTDKTAWDHWTGEPGELSRIKVAKKLAPGSYWLAITAGEERMFGPIRMSRQSQRGVPFSIVR
jgi:hypothetical protein